MSHESVIRRGRHCVFKLHVHLVFVAKYRRRVFDARAIDVLRGVFADVCSDAQATLVEMDGEGDHVHLLVEYPNKVAVASLMNSLKGVSSRLLTIRVHVSRPQGHRIGLRRDNSAEAAGFR